jgi:pimeloyl-ACP methyl ester carboxylesterase
MFGWLGAPRERRGTRALTWLLCGCLFVLTFQLVSAPSARAASGGCTNNSLPVSLAPGQPADQRVFARLCLPSGGSPQTVQLLVHGCLYNSTYWDFPDPSGGTDRYSYVAAALKAGYATLAFDMVGNGQSSHPPSTDMTVDAGVWVLHQVVQALRQGRLSGPGGAVSFSHVIEVSHSFGTFFSWLEVSRYNDVDAAIFTGATHHLSVGLPLLGAFLSLYPADLDPEFLFKYDPGYLTTEPGTRDRIFYQPANVDPAVVTYDEAHKDLLTATEFSAFPVVLATPLDIRVPVLTVLGGSDPLFCSPTATDCTSAAAMASQEAPFYGPNVPSVDGYLLAGAGHSINLMTNADNWFAFAQSWAQSKVPAS